MSGRTASVPRRGPRGFVDAGGERVYYEVYGEGSAVVFSHGFGGNHASWFQQVMPFARHHQVVVWDQRGFGRSPAAAGRIGPQVAAADLEGLLDHLGLERVHLVGQSMGGWASMGLALRSPPRVLSLTLGDSIAGIYTPEIERAYDAVRRARAAGPPLDFHPPGMHPALGPDLVRRDPSRAFLYEQLAGLAPPPPTAALDLLRSTAFDHRALRRLSTPALFVVGSGDPIFPPAVIRRAASLLAASWVVEIPGTGHSPYFERPEVWNATVLRFLAARGSVPP